MLLSSLQNPNRSQCYIFSTANKLFNKSRQCKQTKVTRDQLLHSDRCFSPFPISSKVQQATQRQITPRNAKRIIEKVFRPSNKQTHGVQNSVPSLLLPVFDIMLQFQLAVTRTYDVIVFILSLVNFNPIFNNSVATSGNFSSRSLHLDFVNSHTMLSFSAITVPERSVSEKNGSSPQVVPATMDS